LLILLPRGCWANVAGLFSVDPKTVARLQKDISAKTEKELPALNQDADQQQCLMDRTKGLPDSFFASGAAKRRGGKHVHDREAIKATIKTIPSNKRRKLRHLAAQLNMPLMWAKKSLKRLDVCPQQWK